MSTHCRRLAISAALILTSAAAQEFRSSIVGRVVDPQQAAVPNVRVSATHLETGARSETVSNAEGQYTLSFLAPGLYSISAETAGFKKYVRQNVHLRTNERLGLDIQLELGQATESVTVTAEAPALETATASTGQVINPRQIENMPLNGRTPLVLAQLAFGVVPASNPQHVRPFDNSGPSDFSMGGAPRRTNELLLDGAPDTTANNRVAYNPPVDTVLEVKVETFQADAAYGHTGGGTVNLVLKSGTNNLHGTAYEFNQVSRLAATPFFTNRAGLKKTVTRYNQWGANAGGPVIVPKLFNGRNRLFFYFAYEGLQDGLPGPSVSAVPTESTRGGDFSELSRIGSQYQIYDPATGIREGSRVRRLPFPGNIIPRDRISPIAQKILDFFPPPNNPGRPDGSDNFISRQVERNFYHNEFVRGDFVGSDRHKLFVNYRHNNRDDERGFFDNLGGEKQAMWHIADGNTFHRTNYGALVDDVHTFTPTLLLNTRLNWTRFVEGNLHYSDGFDFTSLGFPRQLLASCTRVGLPSIEISGYKSLATGDRTNDNAYDIFQIFATVTKIAGRHSIKTGADLRLYRENAFDFGNSAGAYSFGTNWTRGPLDNSAAAPFGQSLASFLLGLPTGGGWDLNATRSAQAGYYALFLQDDFRVRSSLTLNLGLRVEGNTPTTERYNRSVRGFDFATASPIEAAAAAAYARTPIPELPVSQFRVKGGLTFADASRRALYDTGANWSPRFGFAWTPAALGNKTVFRGGTGVYFFPVGISGVIQTGFSQTTPFVPTLDGYLTPWATLANPFPTGIEQPAGATLGLMTYAGRSVSFFNPAPRNPYSVRWTFNVQRELPWRLIGEIGYTGNHGVRLTIDRPLNFLPAQYWSRSLVRDQAVIDWLTANVANPFAGLLPGTGLNGSTVARNQLLRGFPHFTGVSMQSTNQASSYFHQLALRMEKRFSSGLQLLVNYQFSKLIERRSRLNEFDAVLEKVIGDDDRPQRLVGSVSYEMPFGRGRAIGAGAGALLNAFIGGWVVNAIYIAQSGRPLSWGNVLYLGGDVASRPRAIDRAFNTDCFNTNPREQLQWNVRTFPSRFANLRGDRTNNVDMSAIKEIRLYERLKLQYRFELFNAMNHAVFSRANTSPTSSSFGRITGQENRPRIVQMGLRLVW